MSDDAHDQYWPDLNPAQADGRACVICARPRRGRGLGWLPVGRSSTGSPVFACAGECAQLAEQHIAHTVRIPEEALTAAGAAFLQALEAAGGDVQRAWPDDLVSATVTAAAPLIVAAELRHLASGSRVQQWESAFGRMVALIPAADVLARADQLDPAGGGERR